MECVHPIEVIVLTHNGSRELKNDAAIAAALNEEDLFMEIPKQIIYGAFMKTVKDDIDGSEHRVLEITTRAGRRLYTREENADKFFYDWTGAKLESEV